MQKPSPAARRRPRQLQIIRRAEHGISRRNISPNCLKVLYKLNAAGYQAFIVGGGVRDLLLGEQPKDFDIATDATPAQIKAVFSRARIIGRRFRIVHVAFGREIIEVSTFRAAAADGVTIQGERLGRRVRHIDSARSNSGMILRDNVYGDLEGDIQRRDFTVNALYYTVQDFAVHDYVRGMEDLENRTLRMIGDPQLRYREDPVRMLRAIRLAVKLNFGIAAETALPIKSLAHLLESIPPARLFDELLKLFLAGKSLPTYQKLLDNRIFAYLFPATGKILQSGDKRTRRLLERAFASTDQRIAEGKPVTPAFLLAAILWPPLQRRFQENTAAGHSPMLAMHDAAQAIISQQVERIAIPRRFSIPIREIWEYQLRLPRRRQADALLTHKRFRAAYDFILLREAAGENLQGLGQWWTRYQEADKQGRDRMKKEPFKSRRRSKAAGRGVKFSQEQKTKPSTQGVK